jgi:nicotinamide-nucleotide amidase
MAQGVCRVLSADVGVATTGVAGPDPQDGQPVGRVFLAVAWGEVVQVRGLLLDGDRWAVRRACVDAALDLVAEVVGLPEDPSRPAR